MLQDVRRIPVELQEGLRFRLLWGEIKSKIRAKYVRDSVHSFLKDRECVMPSWRAVGIASTSENLVHCSCHSANDVHPRIRDPICKVGANNSTCEGKGSYKLPLLQRGQ